MSGVKPVSPYSTGGGGTVLEHRYGAVLLAHLLSGAPLFELDDVATMTSVQFQARDSVAVDDYLIRGVRSDGSPRAASIAARRAPLFRRSSPDARELVAAMLEALDSEYEEYRGRRWRIALASAVSSQHAREIGDLAAVAREVSDSDEFQSVVLTPGRVNRQLKGRLEQFVGLVGDAASGMSFQNLSDDANANSWLLLSGLRVRLLHLEGSDTSDRTSALTLLAPLAPNGSLDSAETMYGRLIELVGNYAPTAAIVTESTLRADLGPLISPDIWVDGFQRRVSRDSKALQYLNSFAAEMTLLRHAARRSLGLTDDQVARSFLQEPEFPDELNDLAIGQTLVLSGPVGAGKSDIALRWLYEGRPMGPDAWGAAVPVLLRADQLQSSIEESIENRTGIADAPDRFGVDLVIDGLDERAGASPIGLAQEFVRRHVRCRVVLTAREGEYVPRSTIAIPIAEWDVDSSIQLIASITGREPWQVGHGWTPDFFRSIRRPLFALLAAVHSSTSGASRAELVDLAVTDALGSRTSLPALEALAVETIRAGRPLDPRSISTLSLDELQSTRLIEFEGSRVRFALPIFEQWFAAQAVLAGRVASSEFTKNEVEFARWRYVLAIAVSSGTHETIAPWLIDLARSNPAAASWVVREGSRSGLGSANPILVANTIYLGEQIWAARTAWAEGLGVLSPLLNPGGVPGYAKPGEIEGLQLTVGLEDSRVEVTWAPLPTPLAPRIVDASTLSEPVRAVPARSSYGPSPDSESWVWTHTLKNMDKKALRDLLTSGLYLAKSCPPDGIVSSEFEYWLAARVLGFNDHWPATISSDRALEAVATVLREREASGETEIAVDKFRVSVGWIQELERRIETGGDDTLRGPWPGGDVPNEIAGAKAYSPARALERANAVYAGAAQAYEEIRAALFPKFGRILAHAATFPAVLEGRFESNAIDVTWGGDFGSTAIDYWFRPVRDGSQAVPLNGNLEWGSRQQGFVVSEDESDEDGETSRRVFTRRRREDPLGSAFELTSVFSSVIMNSFWGRRPASHIAVDWLLHDLGELGWIDDPVVWTQLR